jgi:hypothetical protein
MGMFNGRGDLTMNVVAMFNNRIEARELEGKLKEEYSMEWTEMTKHIKGGKIAVESGQLAKVWERRKKPIVQYSKSGQFIQKWESGSRASRELNLNLDSISACARGKLKSSGGFIWKYV